MEAIGWILWVLVLFFAVGSLAQLVRLLKTGGVQAGTLATLANLWILAIWALLFADFNKLHLAWLAPLAFVLSLLAMMLFVTRGKWWVLGASVAVNLVILSLLTS